VGTKNLAKYQNKRNLSYKFNEIRYSNCQLTLRLKFEKQLKTFKRMSKVYVGAKIPVASTVI
jgi:hypothetical protein